MRRKLTYWIAPNLLDSQAYNVRAKTQREVAERLVAMGLKRADDGQWYTPEVTAIDEDDNPQPSYGTIRKVVVEYSTVFDLVCKALGEGGIE